ncbi:hypothetical protein SAMN05443247_00079 [Bradyrhizobium erythrophlei]|nr:hypothetical protein SAMN05443247_00079 [Bradyrhizobium erythrophlei]
MAGQRMAENLLRETWANLDSQELRLLLNKRIVGGTGQFDNYEANPNKFYLPLARESCRVALTLKNKRIVAVEPGQAFDADEWKKIAEEIENAILVGPPKVGREYSFSSFRVPGSWCGQRSGVQILPPPPEVPKVANSGENPFILEFPIVGASDDLWVITNHRRIREHRRLTLLLNVLLTSRISFEPRMRESFWAYIPPGEGRSNTRRAVILRRLFRPFHRRSTIDENGESRWLQRWFSTPLNEIVCNALSPPAAERLAEVESEAYYTNVGNDGGPLRVPTDLDESLCRYRDLSEANRSKFDRAAFWMDVASRQWTISVSSSFASLVSAIEALTDLGNTHWVYCEQCKANRTHEVPGATDRFQSFFATYAPGPALKKRRREMYKLRSGILHGSDLMQLDQDLAFGFDPSDFNENELQRELWSITRIALRNWLKNPAA